MRHSTSGQKRSVFRQRRSHVFTVILRPENVTTSGSMVQVLAVRVLKFIMTVEKNTAVAVRTVKWAVSATVLWKYGITYLLSSTVTDMETMKNLRTRTLIPVWD